MFRHPRLPTEQMVQRYIAPDDEACYRFQVSFSCWTSFLAPLVDNFYPNRNTISMPAPNIKTVFSSDFVTATACSVSESCRAEIIGAR